MAIIVEKTRDSHPLALTAPLPLNRHPAMVYLRSLSQGSRPTMEHSLEAIASLLTNGICDALTLDWSKLRYEHTSAIQAILLERYQTTTAKKMLCALKRVLREARKLRLISMDDYITAKDLPTITPHNNIRGRALTSQEIKRLMGVCLEDKTSQGVRDGALIAILRGSGLRRGEVVALKVRDLNGESQTLNIRHGKGDKERMVYLPDSAMDYLNRWLSVRGRKPGALICPILKSGKIENRHLTSQAILLILKKRAGQAGVESFSPHDLRRTFCSDLLDAGVDIVTVQKLAGHASPLTTSKYDRRGKEVKRKAVQKLDF